MEFNVHETFQDTVQGEGYHAGTPADFIRLYGCPVGCFFCDTGYASPDGDYYKKKLPLKDSYLKNLQKKWAPYNSIATWYLWRSLDPIPINY